MGNAYRSVLALKPTGDAVPANVLAGKTFSNADGAGKTGTMVNNGAVSVTLTDQNPTYTIPEGYHNGSGVVGFSASGGDGADLIVTCSSDFAGATISCTDGTTTYQQICPSSAPFEVVFESIPVGTWTISGTVEGVLISTQFTVVDFETVLNSIPEGSTVIPTDDVQTWLHCANIWDKAYTTISQVLADVSTLQALISSNNAADYMARSTTWAVTVTANQSAMSYISLNDYCAEKLLSNSSWLQSICSSSYMENVLNVKVPTLSGSSDSVIFVGKDSDNYPYYAFDNNVGTASASQIETNYPTYIIGYDFGSNVRVKRIDYRLQKTSESASLLAHTDRFYYSNDKNSWTEFASNEVTDSQGKTNLSFVVNSDISARYIAYKTTVATESNGWASMAELQFYGREVS